MILKRRKHDRMMPPKPDAPISCEPHKKWVRGHECCVKGRSSHECMGKIEAHHVKTRGAGGGDEQCVPLCSVGHAWVHQLGIITFERLFKIDLAELSAELWQRSPHGKKWRAEHG